MIKSPQPGGVYTLTLNGEEAAALTLSTTERDVDIFASTACGSIQKQENTGGDTSIGAFFSMNAGIDGMIRKAYFISPIVDMEKLIGDMMQWANVTEAELKSKSVIHTEFGEDLSWEYLCYVREHPVRWSVPTNILYGSKDSLTSLKTIRAFAKRRNAALTVMENGEHWFHTDEQMQFLDDWIRKSEV